MTIRKTKKKVEKQVSLQVLDWVEEMNQAIDNLSENRTRFFFFGGVFFRYRHGFEISYC
jgi:hypothetical protein